MKRIDLIEGILNNIINIIFNCHFEKVSEAFLHVSSIGFLSKVAPHPLSACPQSRLCPDLPVALLSCSRDSCRLFLLPLLWINFSSDFSDLHRPFQPRFPQVHPILSLSGHTHLSIGLIWGIPANSEFSFLALVLCPTNPAHHTPCSAQVLALLAIAQTQMASCMTVKKGISLQ